MGNISKESLIISDWKFDEVLHLRQIAINLIGKELVSEVFKSLVNGEYTFFIAPDCFKEYTDKSGEYGLYKKRRARIVFHAKDLNVNIWKISYGEGRRPRISKK